MPQQEAAAVAAVVPSPGWAGEAAASVPVSARVIRAITTTHARARPDEPPIVGYGAPVSLRSKPPVAWFLELRCSSTAMVLEPARNAEAGTVKRTGTVRSAAPT